MSSDHFRSRDSRLDLRGSRGAAERSGYLWIAGVAVAQRQREIGIHMALGAPRATSANRSPQALAMVVLGIIAGLATERIAGPLIASLLFDRSLAQHWFSRRWPPSPLRSGPRAPRTSIRRPRFATTTDISPAYRLPTLFSITVFGSPHENKTPPLLVSTTWRPSSS